MAISGEIVDAAMCVHTARGRGLLESAYEVCLTTELRRRGLRVVTRVLLPICFGGERVDSAYRLDMLVADQVVVELKTVDKLLAVHEAQVLSYLRLGHYPVGLLINFKVPRLRSGIRRFVDQA